MQPGYDDRDIRRVFLDKEVVHEWVITLTNKDFMINLELHKIVHQIKFIIIPTAMQDLKR